MRKREIKKYGNTWIIKLDTTDINDFQLVEGDMVDIDDLELLEVVKRRKVKNGRD